MKPLKRLTDSNTTKEMIENIELVKKKKSKLDKLKGKKRAKYLRKIQKKISSNFTCCDGRLKDLKKKDKIKMSPNTLRPRSSFTKEELEEIDKQALLKDKSNFTSVVIKDELGTIKKYLSFYLLNQKP